jgi:hypothetical protein
MLSRILIGGSIVAILVIAAVFVKDVIRAGEVGANIQKPAPVIADAEPAPHCILNVVAGGPTHADGCSIQSGEDGKDKYVFHIFAQNNPGIEVVIHVSTDADDQVQP